MFWYGSNISEIRIKCNDVNFKININLFMWFLDNVACENQEVSLDQDRISIFITRVYVNKKCYFFNIR